jgi:hypothetical protein
VGSSRPLSKHRRSVIETRETDQSKKTGFYVGGNVYSDWASVPDHDKIISGDRPNPSRSTGTIFRSS